MAFRSALSKLSCNFGGHTTRKRGVAAVANGGRAELDKAAHDRERAGRKGNASEQEEDEGRAENVAPGGGKRELAFNDETYTDFKQAILKNPELDLEQYGDDFIQAAALRLLVDPDPELKDNTAVTICNDFLGYNAASPWSE